MLNKQRIIDSFNKQGLMKTLGAELVSIEEGKVSISCELSEKVSQQNGFFHAGALTSIVDSACGYAGLSVMPDNADVLSVEFKINLMKPANIEKVIAIGKVVQAGKTLVICEGIITDPKEEKIYAKMMATMICVRDKN
ncbi:MAG: PaaI family thioesterase [Cyanobacteriota bacterium]